jgi:hypothetical protein
MRSSFIRASDLQPTAGFHHAIHEDFPILKAIQNRFGFLHGVDGDMKLLVVEVSNGIRNRVCFFGAVVRAQELLQKERFGLIHQNLIRSLLLGYAVG